MQRIPITPRADWQKTVESQGLEFHTPLDEEDQPQPWWDESAYYRFTSAEVDLLESATYELDKMCLDAVEHVISENLFARLHIPEQFIPLIKQSWEADEITIYGRFDLAFPGGDAPPKLLEYNADTPTALLEAAVVQWFWMKDVQKNWPDQNEAAKLDQFTTIHDRLIEAWKRLGQERSSPRVLFTAMMQDAEDSTTLLYLRDTAMQAGLKTERIDIDRLGWNRVRRQFVDGNETAVDHLFKLYPWEWMLQESFGAHLLESSVRWLEPPWKMILSNKGILPILWELNQGSRYLLEAHFEPMSRTAQVRKPIFGREGANIAIIDQENRIVFQTPGAYPGPFAYQALAPAAQFGGQHAVIGSWMINGYAAGIGVREENALVVGRRSRFVPHLFVSSTPSPA
jgi:glutathionylspermidine synthase